MRKSLKSKLLTLAACTSIYGNSILLNLGVHWSNAKIDQIEARNYPPPIIINNRRIIREELLLLEQHHEKSLKELINGWIFFPGSAAWRWVERPDLEYVGEMVEEDRNRYQPPGKLYNEIEI